MDSPNLIRAGPSQISPVLKCSPCSSICRERGNNLEAWQDEFAVTAKLFRQMQLFLEVLNEVLEFRQIFRRRFDQGLVSFQHRLCPSGAVFFFQRYWKSLPVLSYGAHTNV